MLNNTNVKVFILLAMFGLTLEYLQDTKFIANFSDLLTRYNINSYV